MSERTPLQAVDGLARTRRVPGPPPRRVKPITPAAPDSGGVAPEEGTPAAADPPGRGRRKPTTGQRGDQKAQTVRAVTLSLPASLVAGVKSRARTDRVTQPEVLFDALSAAGDRLGELVGAAVSPPVSDGLFLRRATRETSPSDPMATLSMRLLSPNVEAIDALVAKHKAPSRSALCAAALREYLA